MGIILALLLIVNVIFAKLNHDTENYTIAYLNTFAAACCFMGLIHLLFG